MSELALQHKASLVVKADTLEKLAELTPKVKEKGLADIVLDPSGQLLRRHPLGGDDADPVALAVDAWGNAFVADGHRQAVRVVPVLAREGWWLRGPGDEPLAAADLTVDGERRLLVADPSGVRIRVFALDYREGIPSRAPRPER